MKLGRRTFLKTGALGALGVSAYPGVESRWDMAGIAMGTHAIDKRALTARAIDAAMQAGAQYADARLTYTREAVHTGGWNRTEVLSVGVRAWRDGFWGFASSTLWMPDELARLGRDAVALARLNSMSAGSAIREPAMLASTPAVADGAWESPVGRNFFDVSIDETNDYLAGVLELAALLKPPSENIGRRFSAYMQERTFASSEGSYLQQTQHRMQGLISFGSVMTGPGLRQGGWDLVTSFPWREDMLRQLAEGAEDERLPERSVDVGRFDVVFGPHAMASLVSETLAPALQLDRALGFEANARGTSYLGPDPAARLGTPVASPAVTLRGERSTPQALGTVAWDDEGVAPEPFTLVENGVLIDYQTNRDQAARLDAWYKQRGIPVRSHGCAAAPDASAETMQHVPNLVLQAASAPASLDDLARQMGNGLIVTSADIETDFQCLHGGGRVGGVYEVRGGKRVARIAGAGILFNATELWKNVSGVGGTASGTWTHSHARWHAGVVSDKGEPEQHMFYSIHAVPALIKQVTLVDPERKA